MSRLVVFYLFNDDEVWMCTWYNQRLLELESLLSGHQHFMTHAALAEMLAENKADITANAAIAVLQASIILAHRSRGTGTKLAKR